MSDNRQEVRGFDDMLSHNSADTPPAVTPWAATGIGVGAFVLGIGAVLLWPDKEPEPIPAISVYSCAEQYTTIADSLNTLVSEGIQAGQASEPDVSWINSVNERQDVFASQLENLSHECTDAQAPR